MIYHILTIILVLLCLPCIWSCLVGISRYIDCRHTIADILAGGVIGSFIAITVFFTYKDRLYGKKKTSQDEIFDMEFE